MKKLTIGSRDSMLALIQTFWVKAELEKLDSELEIEVIKIKTQGDKILDTALSKIGDKGLFVKELEHRLLDNTIDLAVHSMKDLPTRLPEGLEIVTTSVREDIRDVVCLSQHAQARGIKSLVDAEVVATSSLRRISQLKALYPNKKFVDIRGNLNTRMKKLDDEANEIDALILAAAGIKRIQNSYPNELIFQNRISEYLEPDKVLPAVGQGALAIEIASHRHDIKPLLRKINCDFTESIVKTERAFLRTLEGGCQIPIGIYSQISDAQVTFYAVIYSLDGASKYQTIESIQKNDLLDSEDHFGKFIAQKLIDQGAKLILDDIRLGAK